MKILHRQTLMVTSLFFIISGQVFAADASKEFNRKLEFAYFEPKTAGKSGSAGFKYEFDYSIAVNDPLAGSTTAPQLIPARQNFYNINAFAKGSVPFKEDFPIADFLETGFDVAWESAKVDMISQPCDGYCDERVPDDSFVTKLALNYQFESDSEFDDKQHAYGLKFRSAYKLGSNSALQQANPLEWLPSLVQFLVGDGIGLSENKTLTAPKPFSNPWLPSLGIALEQIDPEHDENRARIDRDLGKYDRYRIDLAHASTLFGVGDDLYRASFTWRYFRELNPDGPIEAAGLHRFRYSTFAIHTPQNIVISYSSGKLPFDFEGDEIFQIGWEFNF